MTQHQSLIKYLGYNKTITSWNAYNLLGITQLGRVIDDLQKDGVDFDKVNKTVVNRTGRRVRITIYKLTNYKNAIMSLMNGVFDETFGKGEML